MNLTDLQEELRSLASSVDERLSALHREIDTMKPHDKPQPSLDFARITSVAARHPLTLKQLQAADPATQKSFLAALAYFTALDSTRLEDKLYYLCRLAQGCEYQPTAEELCQMGLDYSSKDLTSWDKHIKGLGDWFVVQALVLANLSGSAVRETLSAVAVLADSLDIEDDKMRELGLAAQAVLRTGRSFATVEHARSWALRPTCKVDDLLTFGNYPQGANGEVQPVEWQVLRRDSDGLLVISKYALDCKKYHESQSSINWSQCTLRKWLNGEFFHKAFDEAERRVIQSVHITNPNSHWNNVPGGPDTDDKIFLLSHDEVESLFANNDKRKCQPTAYAKKNNAYTDNNGVCFWWLRSPGYYASRAPYVGSDGGIFLSLVYYDVYAVRPAFKIAL